MPASVQKHTLWRNSKHRPLLQPRRPIIVHSTPFSPPSVCVESPRDPKKCRRCSRDPTYRPRPSHRDRKLERLPSVWSRAVTSPSGVECRLPKERPSPKHVSCWVVPPRQLPSIPPRRPLSTVLPILLFSVSRTSNRREILQRGGHHGSKIRARDRQEAS